MKDLKTIELDRQTLYDEIWENSLHKTALKYNVTDNKMKEACIAAIIPLPSLSYWGKKHIGIDVSSEVVPLPPSENDKVQIVLKAEKRHEDPEKKKEQREITVPQRKDLKTEKGVKKENKNSSQLSKGIIIVSRQELYDTIWELRNMDKTAKQYDIPITRLTAICKASMIPLPVPSQMEDDYSRYYMKTLPLPESPQTEVKLYTRKATFKGAQTECQDYIQELSELNHVKKDQPKQTARQLLASASKEEKEEKSGLLVSLLETSTLCSMDDDMREKVFRQAISARNKTSGKLHPDVISYKQSIETWENTSVHGYGQSVPAIIKTIDKTSRKRVFGIMDILVHAVALFDGRMQEGASLVIGKDKVEIEFVEGTDEVPHELTKEEARQIAKYNDEKRWNKYASMPNIRKHDKLFNGRLRIRIGNYYGEGERISIGDSKDGLLLEDRIDEIIVAVFEKFELVRIKREKKEEEERKRAEEKRLAEERQKRISEEKDRTRELIACARRHRIAQEIREYVLSMIEAGDVENEWAKWALKKADWYDPVVAEEDDLLGKDVDLKKDVSKKTFLWNF